MKKILFLDFDGVITTAKSRWKLDPEKLELLRQVIEATDCKLVISSSWRRYTLEDTIDSLSNPEHQFYAGVIFPFCDKIIGITSRMYGFKHGCRETHYNIPRGVEIARWLYDNAEEEFTYCILDDDPDMLLEQAPYFIQTSWGDGLNENDVKRAIEILNKEI